MRPHAKHSHTIALQPGPSDTRLLFLAHDATRHTTTSPPQQQRHHKHKMWRCCQDGTLPGAADVKLAQQLMLRQVCQPSLAKQGFEQPPAQPPKRPYRVQRSDHMHATGATQHISTTCSAGRKHGDRRRRLRKLIPGRARRSRCQNTRVQLGAQQRALGACLCIQGSIVQWGGSLTGGSRPQVYLRCLRPTAARGSREHTGAHAGGVNARAKCGGNVAVWRRTASLLLCQRKHMLDQLGDDCLLAAAAR